MKICFTTALISTSRDAKKTQYKGVLLKVMTGSTEAKWRITAHTWNAEDNG
jgi:hypothetical protein